MERIKEKLAELLENELYDLSIGHLYNKERIREMHDLCHLITYDEYAILSDRDISKLLNLI